MWKPLVSIIIPTKNSCRTLEACLLSCKQQTYSNIEIIVVDNFSDDTTKELSLVYTNLFFSQWPERSAQRNYGVKQSHGEYVLIIDSDMQLAESVVEECVNQFTTNNALLGLVIPEESFGVWFRAQCKKLERSYYVWVDRMEAARCFRKDTLLEIGWYDTENIGTEDYDLPQRIKAKFGIKAIWRIWAYIYHDEWKLSLLRSCQKKFYYGQRLNAYKTKEANKQNFQKQSGILKRYGLFFSRISIILQNPLLRFGMLFMKTVEMWSGACWYFWGQFKKIENIY
jgi:glycosyltransferase involved in cell wall biosynthesis